jgi:transposase
MAPSKLLRTIKSQILKLGEQIAQLHEQSERRCLLTAIPGIGKLSAAVIAASLPDPHVFKPGRAFPAWPGVTAGGKEKPGAIINKGNAYIRRLPVLGGAIANRLRRGPSDLDRNLFWLFDTPSLPNRTR